MRVVCEVVPYKSDIFPVKKGAQIDHQKTWGEIPSRVINLDDLKMLGVVGKWLNSAWLSSKNTSRYG